MESFALVDVLLMGLAMGSLSTVTGQYLELKGNQA
jgi:hypothetical protein